MTRHARILIATDLSETANRAQAEAVSLARRDDAELHVLHVELLGAAGTEGFEPRALPDYVRGLGQTALSAAARDLGVGYRRTVTAVVRDATEAGGILRYAAEQDIDLIVVGTHGRGPIGELVVGSVAQRLIREARVPVLVVGANRVAGEPSGGKPVIVAPVDFSPESGRSLAAAAAAAASRKAHLVALHVLDFARMGQAMPANHADAETAARDRLEAFAEQHAPGAEPLVGCGPVADVVLDVAAKRHAGLVVIAPSRHNLLERIWLGSVSKQVVRAAPCPVLVHRDAVAGQAVAA